MQLPAGDSHIKDKRAIIPYGIQAIKKNTGREENREKKSLEVHNSSCMFPLKRDTE